MAITLKNNLGTISINAEIVSMVAGYATMENYGIVGMCAKRSGDSLASLIGRDNLKRGVRITSVDEQTVDIDVYVILQYGVSLPAVAENCRSNVKYKVEEYAGVSVRQVNVHIEGIRVQ